MARMVEIIPKPVKKMPEWRNTAFYFSLVLLLGAVLSFFLLSHFERKSSEALQDLEDRIAEIGTSKEKALEVEVFGYQKKINDFSELLAAHQKSSNFFKFLEGICHPRVWLSELNLNLASYQATVSGTTPDFRSLGQQLFIFQSQEAIKSVNLTSLSLGEGGEAKFSLSLTLDPQIFHE